VLRNIKAGGEITKDMLQSVEVGGYNLPEDVIKQQDAVLGNMLWQISRRRLYPPRQAVGHSGVGERLPV
jgi:flagella basal body P-ring formation protein FlgA